MLMGAGGPWADRSIAIHLVTAQQFGAEVARIVTYDERMAGAAPFWTATRCAHWHWSACWRLPLAHDRSMPTTGAADALWIERHHRYDAQAEHVLDLATALPRLAAVPMSASTRLMCARPPDHCLSASRASATPWMSARITTKM